MKLVDKVVYIIKTLDELYPEVTFFNPNLEKIFSKGKNSPNGTRLILLYTDNISNL